MVSGSQLRLYNLLRGIAEQHEVWLVSFLDRPEEIEGVPRMEEFCHRVETVKLNHRPKPAYLPGLLRYAVMGRPPELVVYHSDDLAHRIHRLVSSVHFDLVQIEGSSMALYLEALPSRLRAKSLLTFIDVQFERGKRISQIEKKPSKKLRAWLHSWIMRRWEPYYAQRFGRCITLSEVDRRLLITANPRLRVSVVPIGVDTRAYRPLPLNGVQPSLLFVGTMNYTPNADAVTHFCHEILPLIWRRIGDVEMWIVGADPGPEITALNGKGVHVTGRVTDVVPYYSRSTVCVVPLRAGGGARIKILEAMALGRPVVSTTIGCEGLDVVDGEHLLVADNPERFSEEALRLFTDHVLYERITASARQLVVTRYDWELVAGQLMQVYADLSSEPPSGTC
jgi:glycosyltransferase involved in cell wall biosynthesis